MPSCTSDALLAIAIDWDYSPIQIDLVMLECRNIKNHGFG